MKRSKRNQKGKRRKGSKRARTASREQSVIIRGPNGMPSRITCTFTFQKFALINNATFTFGNVRFQPTNCYDIDPALASTAMPGFAEMAALYRLYRARSFTVAACFTNLDTSTTGQAYVCPINYDPANNTPSAQILNSNRRSRQRAFGFGSGNGVTPPLKIFASIADFAGVRYTGQVDAYTGFTTGSTAPTNNIFVACGVFTQPAMTNGVMCTFRLNVTVDFFELATPAAMLQKLQVDKSLIDKNEEDLEINKQMKALVLVEDSSDPVLSKHP